MRKIYIYGIGRTGNRYYQNLDRSKYEVLGFIDSFKTCNTFLDSPVYYIDEILEKEWDEIHVASVYLEIISLLIEKKVDKSKIVICDYNLFLEYVKNNGGNADVRFSFPCIWTRPMLYSIGINSTRIEFNNCELMGDVDYCRYNTLALLAEEINKSGVDGNIAELGVFRGDFAKYLNRLFPDRKLYLFDTFEGFDSEEQRYEIEQSYTKEEGFIGNRDFKNTSIELVLSKMDMPQNCIIKKGRFPETIPEHEEKYALVSIDCDLYLPVLAGIKYFYPLLSEGGYMMIHDYNSVDFLGIKEAVKECEKIFGRMHKVPLTDRDGTLVISK